MIIHDRIYGPCEISEPVLIELIQTYPLQRLKRVNQAGASQYLYNWKNITRFEHCVGVMLILRKYGASLTEQIAGLLHDAPHTAFSHVVDFVYENKNHEYHEQFHTDIINNHEIKIILEKNRISKKVAHPENYPLLERDLPDLCADRIDYALRDMMSCKRDKDRVEAKLSSLIVQEEEFIFDSCYAAEAFARDYLEMDKEAWANPREIALYQLLAQAIRHALDNGILSHADLFTDDEAVYLKLKSRGDAYVLKKLAYLTPNFRIEPATKNHYHLFVKSKSRYVDPKILIKGKTKRLSEISKDYKQKLEAHIKNNQTGQYVFVYPE